MADQQTTTAGALGAAQLFDLQRFGMEVAGEIGVDPNNLGAYGLTPQKIDQYEQQLHSGTQRGSR
ncbi:MAG TPA: hypothetical protein VNT75_16845 [Symbiobacteriaceae bacterium]|nr:hypothetical protein [Symbiobacteriaceae bacterium]